MPAAIAHGVAVITKLCIASLCGIWGINDLESRLEVIQRHTLWRQSKARVRLYRPLIVTFALSLTVSETLSVLYAHIQFFHTPLAFRLNVGCSLWSRSVMLWSAQRGKVRLISRQIIFQEFQHRPMSRYLNVTDRQTNGQTTCHSNIALWERSIAISHSSIFCSRDAQYMQCESKKSPLRTCGNFSKLVANFSTKFHMPITRSHLR